VLVAIGVLFISVLLVACGGDDEGEETPPAVELSTPAVAEEAPQVAPEVTALKQRLTSAGYRVSEDDPGSEQPPPLGVLRISLPSKASVAILVYATPAEAQQGGAGLVQLAETPKFDPVVETAVVGSNVYSGRTCCVENGAVLDNAEFQGVVDAGQGG
jgi:hypothetical protein